MKARRVLVTIEMTTKAKLSDIKILTKQNYCSPIFEEVVHQVQVNVIKKEKEASK